MLKMFVTEEHINNINFKDTIYGMYKAGITNIVPKKWTVINKIFVSAPTHHTTEKIRKNEELFSNKQNRLKSVLLQVQGLTSVIYIPKFIRESSYKLNPRRSDGLREL